jgi:hypothetical protein
MDRDSFVLLCCIAAVIGACGFEEPREVTSASFTLPLDQGIYDNDELEAPLKSKIRSCDCAPAFWGRERVASICHHGPEEGPPPVRGCLYQRGNMTVFDQPLEPQI